jgi:phosphoribosyl-AMP cyclohydrolase
MDRVDPLIEEAAARLRELEPTAIAIVVIGSYARDTHDEASDLDLKAITRDEPAVPYRTWFQDRPGRKPIHVSAGSMSVDRWRSKSGEPQSWAFGFPVQQVARYVWTSDDALEFLGSDPSFTTPAPEPELEDFVEFVGKVRRCGDRSDAVGARRFAQMAGLLAPRLLMNLNSPVVVHDRREALAAALDLRVAPDHYREDLTICLGLAESNDERVIAAAMRLAQELLAFLRVQDPDVAPQSGVSEALRDGSFERHLGFLD